MTKYVVFVNGFNKNADDSISFESLKDVVKYVSRFNHLQHCSGRVEKLTKRPNDECFVSEIIMKF